MNAAPANPPTDKYLRRVGSQRPNALLYSDGVGSVVDLPHLSVVVQGLDYWDYRQATDFELTEPRLLQRVRQILGPHVRQLRATPHREESTDQDDTEANRVGVPVSPFPRWMRCTSCRLLAGINAEGTGPFRFENKNKFRPDEARFVHDCRSTAPGSKKSLQPTVVPARFVTACTGGHLDEFPYVEYVHYAGACSKGREGRLTMLDPGGNYGSQISIRCSCGAKRTMRDALKHHRTEGSIALPGCRARHPHLGWFDPKGCTAPVRAMVLGASNQWFSLLAKALYIPALGTELAALIEKHWAPLSKVTGLEILTFALTTIPELSPLRIHDPAAIWAEIQARQQREADVPAEPVDLTAREYEALTDPTKARRDSDFTADVVPTPPAWTGLVSKVVQMSRLRETKAMVGFTRVDAPDWGEPDSSQRAPLSRAELDWVPASTTHGEGIFLVLQRTVIEAWEKAAESSSHLNRLRTAHTRWRNNRQLDGVPEDHWPGDRYVLLHTLSHLLVREIALECGYSSASITERIYANTERGETGILLYTAASDSEGTLGGLVRLADPTQMDRLLRAAFANARRCSSDPLCAEHAPLITEDTLHGAACHACLFASETTCERGNRFLDRRLIVPVDPNEQQLALDGYFTIGTP
ncbi:DrmB family protein [Rhodococcoides fascians]|uniref:DrmB family protein n=1 Tax=Rhodococcoides fascians TaxID=1828 RepID=UPI003670645C